MSETYTVHQGNDGEKIWRHGNVEVFRGDEFEAMAEIERLRDVNNLLEELAESAKDEIERLRADLETESKRFIDGIRHAAEMLEFTEDRTLIYNHLMQLVEGEGSDELD